MHSATPRSPDLPGTATRPATTSDMPVVRRIAARYGLLEHWPTGPDFLDCEREYGTLLVAVARGGVRGARLQQKPSPPALPGDAEPVGFGGVLPRGSLTHLGDLFINEAHQSGGLGRLLLDGLLADSGMRVTFASADPRAVPLYIRYGMIPRCPVYYVAGDITLEGDILTSIVDYTQGTDTVDVERVVAADADASGGERAAVLRWYAGLAGVRVYADADGYAFAREIPGAPASGSERPDNITARDGRSGSIAARDGRPRRSVLIGPAGGATPTAAAAAVLAAAARYPGRTLRLALFGPHPLLPRLLAAGMRIEDTDTYLASRADVLDLDRYVPSPDLG